MKLKEMNERQLLFECIKFSENRSEFLREELIKENEKRMQELAYPEEKF